MAAYRAARDWAAEHDHFQPDDRMIDAVLALVERDYDVARKGCYASRFGAGEVCKRHGCVYPGDDSGVGCRSLR
jgi:hypothetical protein